MCSCKVKPPGMTTRSVCIAWITDLTSSAKRPLNGSRTSTPFFSHQYSLSLLTSSPSVHLVNHSLVCHMIISPTGCCASSIVLWFNTTYGGSFMPTPSTLQSLASFQCLMFLWQQILHLHHRWCNSMTYQLHWHCQVKFSDIKKICSSTSLVHAIPLWT
jgi:hypothetical protein